MQQQLVLLVCNPYKLLAGCTCWPLAATTQYVVCVPQRGRPPAVCLLSHTTTHIPCRGMLQSTIIDANLPAASSRYQNATAAQDSDDDAGSPQRHPHNNYAATGSTSKPHIGAALLQAISPLSAGPLSCGPAGMAGSHVTSRTASYTAATHRAGAAGAFRAFRLASGRSSPEVSQAVVTDVLSSGGFSPMSAALHAKQQLGLSPQQSVSPGAVDAARAPAVEAGGGVAGLVASRENVVSPGPSRLGGRGAHGRAPVLPVTNHRYPGQLLTGLLQQQEWALQLQPVQCG